MDNIVNIRRETTEQAVIRSLLRLMLIIVTLGND